ncbi:MAG: hypothetical protein DMG70_07610 [Acidobacteria bacterium]|nr:MAG: hypothetical protein DMG70_07610 [Acidobacteriota bacterium]PYY08028.1 MAG: hypothetical protein DMG69_16510 [Acidobacteriota bacterium]
MLNVGEAQPKGAFQYRLYPTLRQKSLLRQTLEVCRMLYNDALHERKDAYRSAASRGIVALVQVRLPPIQFFLDKVVPVQEIGGLEKQRSKPPASPSLPAPHPGCRSKSG